MRVRPRIAAWATLLCGCSVVIGDLAPPSDTGVDARAPVDASTDAMPPAPTDAADAAVAVDAAPPPADQSLPADAAPAMDQAPPICAAGDLEQTACGINERGVRSRLCEGGAWGAFGVCVDPDECADGSEDHAVCGPNERGIRVSTCDAGQWTAPGACMDTDECLDGTIETEACPDAFAMRERTCDTGRWTDWSMCIACLPGQDEARGCGLNGRGTQSRTCEGFQSWSDWTECDDPDVCVDGDIDTERCGPRLRGDQMRVCAEGRWGDWGECEL